MYFLLLSIIKNGQFLEDWPRDFETLEEKTILTKVLTTRSATELANSSNGLRNFIGFDPGEKGTITYRISVIEGSSITSDNFTYQPYAKYVKNIYLNEPLRKIDNYTDYIDFKKKKVIRKIKELILNGSETDWQKSTLYIGNYWIFSKNRTRATYYITSHFKSVKDINEFKKGTCYTGDTTFDLWLGDETNYTTIESFKTWLSNNNVTVDYILATPTEEDIELPNIALFENNNNIILETEILPKELYIEYRSKKKEKKDFLNG